MRIANNITALSTYNNYTANNASIAKSVKKLSSGYQINSAADNAAGLAISEKMRAQIRGLNMAVKNSQDAISLVQTAEGALQSTHDVLQRMRELATQSASDTNETIDRDALQAEFKQLQDEIDDTAVKTSFNNKTLLDGSYAKEKLSVGGGTSLAGASMSVSVGNAKAGDYAFGVSVVTIEDAVSAKAADTLTVASSSVNSAYFSGASVASGSISSTASSLLNGNYSISVGDVDTATNSFTLTATSDSGLTYSAKISAGAGFAEGATISANFGSDAFTLNFTSANAVAAGMGEQALTNFAEAFSGTSFTISGGVDGKDAVREVQASLTGASNVTLKTGDSSVTFDNGVTVNFEELKASDLDTNANFTAEGTLADTNRAVTANTDGAGATATIDLASVVTSDAIDLGAGTVYSVSINGSEYSYIQQEGDTSSTIMTALATAINGKVTAANTGSASATTPTLTFTAAASGTTITLTSQTAATAGHLDAADLAVSGRSGTEAYNYTNTFGEASSAIQVKSSANSALTFQVGANEGDELVINVDRMDSEYLGVNGSDISTRDGASKAITQVNDAINQVSTQRAALGAIQNRLDYKINNLKTSSENLTSAESLIRDVDMASEMTAFTNANILQQAATAMLAQANALPQNVLSLLG